MQSSNAFVRLAALAGALLATLMTSACGGGRGGPGPDGAGQGLILINFLQSGADNIALNTILEFQFSEPVLASSVDTSSIQIRKGPSFGESVPGVFRIEGASVFFEPRLPGLCDLSDGGFDADTQYRVQLSGYREGFSIRNTQGQPLNDTSTFEFHTRAETDPERFIDQIAGFGPTVLVGDSTPKDGDQALSVNGSNQVVLRISENLNPCTVNLDSVIFSMVETGDIDVNNAVPAPNGNRSGFYAGSDPSDQDPSLFSWGADVATSVSRRQRVIASIELRQTFALTEIVITPSFAQFPENALLVVQLTSDIQDFGGQPLAPFGMSFTTENLAGQSGTYEMRVEGETPFLENATTADENTARAPGLLQGYLLFAGDGDNGLVETSPSGPAAAPACSAPLQLNDGTKDDFDPDADVVLNTGATVNTCLNQTDGSTAVVWEFNSFRIASGVTVRVVGVNPAIVLVQGDIVIENGGRLLLRGDGTTGVPQGNGGSGRTGATGGVAAASIAGEGVAGGGNGGASFPMNGAQPPMGLDGSSGVGTGAHQTVGGTGSGQGNVEVRRSSWGGGAGGTAGGGGGGGHAEMGGAGQAVVGPNNTYPVPARGLGGDTYPASDQRMLQPSAGSGGGAGGAANFTNNNADWHNGSGGAGGAGGGFVDLTSSGDIHILGTVDAAGGRGGSGVIPQNVGNWFSSAGGGGGSGGGIRLLTPNDIDVTGGTITAAGGNAGTTPAGPGAAPVNLAGAGGAGRVVFEDGDSIITGLGTAAVTPAEGAEGFFRGRFDASRFRGGGTMPQAVSDIVPMGPLNPNYTPPMVADFRAGIPAGTSRGFNNTSIFIEARGYEIQPDGTPDELAPSPWRTVGYFRDSSVETAPNWTAGANPGDVTVPIDNMAGSIDDLDGYEFLQFRITFYLPNSVGPFDPGPYLDDWTVRFTHDQ